MLLLNFIISVIVWEINTYLKNHLKFHCDCSINVQLRSGLVLQGFFLGVSEFYENFRFNELLTFFFHFTRSIFPFYKLLEKWGKSKKLLYVICLVIIAWKVLTDVPVIPLSGIRGNCRRIKEIIT